MRVVINDHQIIGIERYIAKAIVNSICDRCLHHTIAHQDTGCLMVDCKCKKGYTSSQLLTDQDFIQEIIKEGLIYNGGMGKEQEDKGEQQISATL